jgi:ParB-like chromosome segregation protein Spo0J
MKKLNLNAIRIDGGTQPREQINMEVVGDYAEAVKVGIEFPPVIVFHDGAENWLADGFHRWHAHKQAGKVSIEAEVRAGTLLDAKLLAVGANGDHGLRRSNEDKRRAVQMVLDEPAWKDWSDRKIAEACGVSAPFVSAIRRPAVAVRQQEARAKTAEKRAPACNPITPQPAPTKPKREIAPQPPADDEQMAEAQHTIAELAQENDQLRDKLAVESLMDSEEAKTQTAETIRELRALVKTLEAENAALKVSRDTYQREAYEAKKSAIYWRKQAEKAAKDAA